MSGIASTLVYVAERGCWEFRNPPHVRTCPQPSRADSMPPLWLIGKCQNANRPRRQRCAQVHAPMINPVSEPITATLHHEPTYIDLITTTRSPARSPHRPAVSGSPLAVSLMAKTICLFHEETAMSPTACILKVDRSSPHLETVHGRVLGQSARKWLKSMNEKKRLRSRSYYDPYD